jgi:hypothetical protein
VAYGTTPALVSLAGFSVIRVDKDGNLMWQVSRVLCSFSNLECGQWEIEAHLATTPNGFIPRLGDDPVRLRVSGGS